MDGRAFGKLKTMAKVLIIAMFIIVGRVEAFISHRGSSVPASRLRTRALPPAALTMTAAGGGPSRGAQDGAHRGRSKSSLPLTPLARQLRQSAGSSAQLLAFVDQHSDLGAA